MVRLTLTNRLINNRDKVTFPFLFFREVQNSIRLGELGEAKKNQQLNEQFELLNEAFK